MLNLVPFRFLFYILALISSFAHADKGVLANIVQLTFEGNRSGEGYFSSTGSKICYQSENVAGNPFYQIYSLDLVSGENTLISSGVGKTTCAWFYPTEEKILYASTHLDPTSRSKQKEELELRKSGKQKKYSWDYDPNYDLFSKNLTTGKISRLTNSYGYDAECAYSPDGKKIVFTSNRHAYDQNNDPAILENPSFHNEIYLMHSNGQRVTRLTDHLGYDGGPFFDSTGENICWRRFSPDGHKAEIYTMSINDRVERKITQLNAMSWAPFFHPSNEYIIFSTNLHGFHNFELYIVDFFGKKKPVRITEREGFDGLPSFSPDGNTISWTSNATPAKKSQIFLANWNHEDALRLLNESPSVKGPKPLDTEVAKKDIKSSLYHAKKHVEYLSSENLEGRSTGSPGLKKANEYVASHFENNNLKEYFDGTWYQDFSFFKHAAFSPESSLDFSFHDKNLIIGKDWNPLAFSDSGKSLVKEITFVGYGIRITDENTNSNYDSYTHLDVENKWVLCLRKLPPGWSGEKKEKHFYHSTLRKKASTARDLGAKGIIFISDTNDSAGEVIPFASSTREKISIQAISLNRELTYPLFTSNGKDYKEVSKLFEKGNPAMGFVLKNLSFTSNLEISRIKGICQNTVGYLDLNKNNKLDHPFILVGAHIDHIGKGKHSSRAKKSQKGKIHPGADDNGSGISALLEIIRMLLKNEFNPQKPMFDVVFAAWSGEEIGLVGSSHFANKLLNQNHSGANPIVAYLNMDMVGRLNEKMTIHGVGSSTQWRKIIQMANVPVRLNLNLQNDSHIPTDTTSFFTKGVPIISAFTGLHNDYHSPSDTADKINYDGIIQCSKLFTRIVSILSQRDRIDYVSQVRPSTSNRAKLRAYLGTIPDYSQTDAKGVLLSGVSKNGPADLAGILAGDLIVELSNQKVENIYDYTDAIGKLIPKRQVTVRVIRSGEKIQLDITPKAR